jgi:hypothetical protein
MTKEELLDCVRATAAAVGKDYLSRADFLQQGPGTRRTCFSSRQLPSGPDMDIEWRKKKARDVPGLRQTALVAPYTLAAATRPPRCFFVR